MSNHDLPLGWRTGTISDIAVVNPSVSLTSLDDNVDVSFLTMADVGENGRVLNHQVRQLREVRAGFTRFEEGDVLFAKITPCMENGKGAFARNLVNHRGFGSTEFHVLRANDQGDAEFIYHLAQSSEVRTKAIAFFTGSAGQQRVDVQFFYRLPLLIPPPHEQCKIARILTTLDNLIEKTEAMIAKYQAIKQGMMHDLFTRGLDAHGHLRPPQTEAPDLYRQSELGWIPKEWASPTVGSVLVHRPKNGYSPKESDEWTGTVMLGLGCLTPSGFEPIQLKNAPRNDPNLASALLRDGDLLISRSNTRDLVALVGIYRDIGTPCIYSDLMIRLVPTDDVLPEYLEAILRHAPVRRQLTNASCGTSGSMMKINAEMVLSTVISLPKHVEQRRILDRTASCSGLITQARQEHDKLRRLKSGLMQDLLTGKVRVKVDELEEVADA